MPYHCVQQIERALNDAGLPVKGAKIALFGVSYKPNVGDTRESPALKMITLLQALGARVAYHDPFVAHLAAFGIEHETVDTVLQDADIAVVVTAHADVDHDDVIARAPRTIDLRGVTRGTSRPAVQRL